MLNIPVQTEVTEARTVAVTTPALHQTQCGASVVPCPYCGTHEQPEDRDGVISCPNCGYPLTQQVPLIDEWEMLIADASDPLDETGWAHLLTEIDALGMGDNSLC